MKPLRRFGRFSNAIVQRSPIVTRIAAIPVIALAILAVAGITSCGWLSASESASATVANISLVIAGPVVLALALWRSTVASRQADTAQQSLLNERYQQGSKMLGNKILSVRLGGIYALQSLATDDPDNYHVQVIRLLCAFVRQPAEDRLYEQRLFRRNQDSSTMPAAREDIQAAIDVISARNKRQIEIESEQDFTINLMGADLSYVQLRYTNLSGAMLNYTNFSHAYIYTANFSHTKLRSTIFNESAIVATDFTEATAWGVKLIEAVIRQNNRPLFDLDHSNLSEAQFYHVILTDKHAQYANLSGAIFRQCKLNDMLFLSSDLSNVKLFKCELTNAHIIRTDMSNARLRDTDLSGTYFYDRHGGMAEDPVRGLTQARLDEACASPDDPPRLGAAVDATTGEQLVWRGKECKG